MLNCPHCKESLEYDNINRTVVSCLRYRLMVCKHCHENIMVGYDKDGKAFEIEYLRFRCGKREVKKIVLFSKQVNCPVCDKVVLAPDCNMRKPKPFSIIQENTCMGCGSILEFCHEIDYESWILYVGIKEKHTKPSGTIVCNVFSCEHIGVAGTTDIFVRTNEEGKYVARVGIAILGGTNFEASIGANPFDKYFHDNYSEGVGTTVDEALAALKEEMHKLSHSLFAE